MTGASRWPRPVRSPAPAGPGVSQHRLRADQDFAAQHRVHRDLPGRGAAAVRHHLPLTKTLIVLTFLLGLLPVIGNLMSNTLITIVGLSLSIWVAVAALGYLIVIHKLEYFLNARIVGGQISAKSWELLLAMLVFEAAFGLPGVAGPIYYAYLKSELKRMDGLIQRPALGQAHSHSRRSVGAGLPA
jgi:hypothetical protein